MKYLKFILVTSILVFSAITHAGAQIQGSQWSSPLRISSWQGQTIGAGTLGGMAGAALATDQYGYIHAFWRESGFTDERVLIQYARFDGITWTSPIDIFTSWPNSSIGMLATDVDMQGTLHLIWTGGMGVGPVYYMHAPAQDALSVRFWSKPLLIDIPAHRLKLQVDSQDTLHILYSKYLGQSGLFHIRSDDGGNSWSTTHWLDSDILPDHNPNSLQFLVDDEDRLHAVWYYESSVDVSADWVRYSHSDNSGDTWSNPFTIDRNTADTTKITFPGPVMAIDGRNVHVVWAAGPPTTLRHHRYSTDGGQTWSAPLRFMGDLDGQAGDGLAIDGAGRVHYFAQVRYPQGIWHAIWDQDHWENPSLIYLMNRTFDELMGDRLSVHDTNPVIREGNQIVLTFFDHTAERPQSLYEIHRILDDIRPLPAKPTPTSTPTPDPQLMQSPTPLLQTPTSTMPPFNETDGATQQANSSSFVNHFWVAIIPTIILLGSVVSYQLLKKLF